MTINIVCLSVGQEGNALQGLDRLERSPFWEVDSFSSIVEIEAVAAFDAEVATRLHADELYVEAPGVVTFQQLDRQSVAPRSVKGLDARREAVRAAKAIQCGCSQSSLCTLTGMRAPFSADSRPALCEGSEVLFAFFKLHSFGRLV